MPRAACPDARASPKQVEEERGKYHEPRDQCCRLSVCPTEQPPRLPKQDLGPGRRTARNGGPVGPVAAGIGVSPGLPRTDLVRPGSQAPAVPGGDVSRQL